MGVPPQAILSSIIPDFPAQGILELCFAEARKKSLIDLHTAVKTIVSLKY